jgi:galactokinase
VAAVLLGAAIPSADRAAAGFRARFGRAPRLFQAPGRINIIGEHTDYSGGLVLPAAIDRRTVVAASPNGSRTLNVIAAAIDEEGEARLDALAPRGDWLDYVAGVAAVLMGAGVAAPGADLWIESDVPIGAGVSASAALEVAVARALTGLAGVAIDGPRIARLAQAAENDFAGMPCGIMDQYASANGVAGAAILLDCATLRAEPVPLPDAARFLVVDSGVRHAHAGGEYRVRRAECEAAAAALGAAQLGEVTPERLSAGIDRLPEAQARRARHVVSENARVREAAAALRSGDLAALGGLMNASHASLRDDMQVSVAAVDALAAAAQSTPGVFGARMMGGGFGGAVLALADAARAEAALGAITAGSRTSGFICRAVDGAGEIAA